MKYLLKVWLSFILSTFSLYTEGALSLRSQGFNGDFGLGKETTWGTPVAVTDYVELLSENLSMAMDRFDTRNIYGGRYEPRDSAGLRRVSGSIVHAAHPVSMGHFLRAFFNNCSQTAVLSGALWTNNFTSTATNFADGVPLQPYTLEVFRDVTSSHRYAGALANRMTLAYAPNQDVRCTIEWLAKSRTLLSRTTPTYPGSPAEPFTFDTASISLGGSATARIEALTIQGDNQLEGIAALNASTEIARIRNNGPQLIRVSGTLDFIDVTEEQDFINQTSRVLEVNVFKSQSFAMRVVLPVFEYTAFPTGQSGRGRNTVAFEGKAQYSASSATSILVQLTTIKSNY